MPHDNPIQQLTHEHHHILQVVHGLSAIDQALAAGDRPDPARLRTIVAFMREFADQCHHAKEEAILFPAMEDKGVPHGGCPLEALRREHVLGRERVGALAAAIDALERGDNDAPAALHGAIAALQQLYPNHIWKEDQMVFPMAERLFTPAELDALNARFEQAEIELGQDHDRYVAFAEEMAALLGQTPRRHE
ncbi:MAG TPA: hemerythrin [Gammaproteobacteria bacterium]|nr:hemerythrin [Gammaproteobacteria bacterium]